MRRRTRLVGLLICILLLTGCYNPIDSVDNPNIDAVVKKFVRFITDGEYLKAVDHYNEKIYGNYALENEATDEITNLLGSLNDDILKGEKTESDSKVVTGVIDNVLSETNLYIQDYDKIKESIEVSVASKAAFLAGKELEELRNYADAIAEYASVIDTDSNFSDAKTAISRCGEILKQNVFDKAAVHIEKREYIEAIGQVKALRETLPNDDEVIAKISVYEKTYISSVIDAAAEAFVSPGTDYAKSLEIINSALQHCPDNEELNAKKTYYQSFAPVYLYDMPKLKGEADTFDTDKDIYGNNYEKCFWSGYSSAIWHNTDISYYLEKNFNTFTATVYSRSTKNKVQNMVAEIYADGKILYQNLKIADNATPPFTISLDVTGVTELRIVLTQNGGAIGAGIGMTDMIVQKTVK